MLSKNRYELVLGVKVGPVELEMNRDTIISILGTPESSRNSRRFLTDYYHSKNLHIDYSLETKTCKGIQVINGAELIYNGIDLLGCRWETLLQWLRESDPNLDIDVGIYTSHVLKISTGPGLDYNSDTKRVETIVTFTDDYWESDEEMNAAIQREIQDSQSAEEMARELRLEDFLQYLR